MSFHFIIFDLQESKQPVWRVSFFRDQFHLFKLKIHDSTIAKRGMILFNYCSDFTSFITLINCQKKGLPIFTTTPFSFCNIL